MGGLVCENRRQRKEGPRPQRPSWGLGLPRPWCPWSPALRPAGGQHCWPSRLHSASSVIHLLLEGRTPVAPCLENPDRPVPQHSAPAGPGGGAAGALPRIPRGLSGADRSVDAKGPHGAPSRPPESWGTRVPHQSPGWGGRAPRSPTPRPSPCLLLTSKTPEATSPSLGPTAGVRSVLPASAGHSGLQAPERLQGTERGHVKHRGDYFQRVYGSESRVATPGSMSPPRT